MGKVEHLKRPNPQTAYLRMETIHFEGQLNEIIKGLLETDDVREAWAYVGRYLQVKNELERIEKLTHTFFTCRPRTYLTFHKEEKKN